MPYLSLSISTSFFTEPRVFFHKTIKTRQTVRAGKQEQQTFILKLPMQNATFSIVVYAFKSRWIPQWWPNSTCPRKQWDGVSSLCTRASRCLRGPMPNSSLMRKPESIQTTCQQSLKSTSGLRCVTLNSAKGRKMPINPLFAKKKKTKETKKNT